MSEKIVVVPYDPEWPALFARLGADLRGALGEKALRIDHIGSSSIPGLAAKPIEASTCMSRRRELVLLVQAFPALDSANGRRPRGSDTRVALALPVLAPLEKSSQRRHRGA